jgi:protein phosphatase 1 regulatory subunit 14B
MECGVTATYTNGGPAAASGLRGGDVHGERSPAKSGLHVNFTEQPDVKKSREKFLTAKYGSHQMSLIRKRLAVEMWLYDELQKLYEIPAVSTNNFYFPFSQAEIIGRDNEQITKETFFKL